MANATTFIPFSASTQGKGVKVVATGTLGTTLHTTGTSSDGAYDRPIIYAYNGHTADVLLTLEWGGVTVPDNTIVVNVPFKSGVGLVVDQIPLKGSGSVAATITVFAGTANVIVLYGGVMRTVP